MKQQVKRIIRRQSGLRFERVLFKLLSQFVDVSNGQLDSLIRVAQRQFCHSLNIDRCGLWLQSESGKGTFLLTHLHKPSEKAGIPLNADMNLLFPWGLEKVMRGEVFVVNKAAELPLKAVQDRKTMASYGIKSMLCFPLMVNGGTPFGILSFGLVKRPKSWSQLLIHHLQLTADIFASALARMKAELQVHRSDQIWCATFDEIQDSIMILDLEFRVIRANTGTMSILRKTKGHVLGKHCYQLFHAGCECWLDCPAVRAIHTGRHENAEVYYEPRKAWLRVSADPMRDSTGKIVGIVHSAQDITRNKEALDAFTTSQTTLLALIESTQDMIWCVDPVHFGFLLFNNGLKTYYFQWRGIHIATGMLPEEVLPKHLVSVWLNFYKRALTEGPFTVEYVTCIKSHTLLLSFSLLRKKGEVFGISVFGKDITQLRRSEAELLLLRESLAHVGRVSILGQLTATIAHELNQPLGAILSNAEAGELFMKKQPPAIDEIREILKEIRKEDQRASQVLDRIRALLKRRELKLTPINMGDVVDEAVGLIRSEAASRRITVVIEIASEIPPVLGDRVYLVQVLLNLMVNAMDSMRTTPLLVRQMIVGIHLMDTHEIKVEVSDVGTGIPEEKLAWIFDPFNTTKVEGLGMGLAISRTLIEAHNGRIYATNNSQGGATVAFVLPLSGHPR